MHKLEMSENLQVLKLTMEIPVEALTSKDLIYSSGMTGYGLMVKLAALSPDVLRHAAAMLVDDQYQQVRAVQDDYENTIVCIC